MSGLPAGAAALRRAPSADTINAMKNFEVRSKQIVAIATRCVTDAAMEFLAARKDV